VEIVPDVCINLQDDSAESMVRFPSSSLDVLLEIEWWYHFQGGSGCSQIFCFNKWSVESVHIFPFFNGKRISASMKSSGMFIFLM